MVADYEICANKLASSYLIIIHLSAEAVGVNFSNMKNIEKEFDINSTNKMSRRQINKILEGNSRIWGVIVRTIQVLIINNPLVFPLWAFLFPRQTARIFHSPFFYRTGIGDFLERVNFWEVSHLLTMKHRFIYMEAHSPRNFPLSDQVIYLNDLIAQKKPWEESMFSPAALKRAWDENIEARKQLVEKGVVLSNAQLLELIRSNSSETLLEYVEKHTVSNKIMEALYKKGYKALFWYQIERAGANSEIISLVSEDDKPHLIEALRLFSQVSIVRTSQKRGEKDGNIFFQLANKEPLGLEAQTELTISQYETLRSLCKHLRNEVILIKANPSKTPNWRTWLKKFLEWENLSFPEWEIFVLNTPQVREFIMDNPPSQVGRL